MRVSLILQVKTDASTAERSMTSGHLVLTMPLATPNVPMKNKSYPNYNLPPQPKPKRPSHELNSIHNIVSADVALTVASNSDLPRNPTCKVTDVCDEDVPPLE